MPLLAAIGLIVGVPLAIKFRAYKIRGIGLGVAVVIGFLLLPYFAFCLGPVHIFAQDNAPEYLRVLEVRPTIDRIVWTEKTEGERTVFQGPVTLYLHPGEQRVYFGTMNIPAGTYISGVIYISRVVVDIEENLSLAGVHPNSYEEEYQRMQQRFGDAATNWSREGAIVRYTWDSGPETSAMSLGEFPYPGFGGPDITLDFVLGEHDGKPESITVIFEMPSGIPEPDIEIHV